MQDEGRRTTGDSRRARAHLHPPMLRLVVSSVRLPRAFLDYNIYQPARDHDDFLDGLPVDEFLHVGMRENDIFDRRAISLTRDTYVDAPLAVDLYYKFDFVCDQSRRVGFVPRSRENILSEL